MDPEQIFMQVTARPADECLPAVGQLQKDGIFEDGGFKTLLFFLLNKKGELYDISPDAVAQLDHVMENMMHFAALYLTPQDMMSLMNPNADTSEADETMARVNELNEMTGQAVAMKNQAVQQRSEYGLQKALAMHNEIIEELQHLNVPSLLARNYYQAAIVCKRLERYDECIDLIERAVTIHEALGAEQQVMSYRIELARVYTAARRHQDAYKLYLALKDYYQDLPAEDSQVFIFDGLAELHWIRNERENETDILQGMRYLIQAVLCEGLLLCPGIERNLSNTFDLYKEFRCYHRVLQSTLDEFETSAQTVMQRLKGYQI